MNIIDTLKNTFLYANKYKTHSEAVIIACYFNPHNNPYRKKAFDVFYKSIKHLNHHIVECVIGTAKPELPEINGVDGSITRVYTKNLLWHKESLLNNIVKKLRTKYKYIFWLDADIIFTNNNWLIDSVNALQTFNIIQPFEFCIHLNKDELKPTFDLILSKFSAKNPQLRHPRLWRSFSSNHSIGLSGDQNYDKHGHVGFAWGARREILDAVPLYDRALIGGSDHIIAHAAAGQIGHSCITKSFTDDIDAVNEWSQKFYNVVKGKIGYVNGDLYHIWHGDVEKRQYLKRIQEFTSTAKKITEKDKNGLHITNDDKYVKDYFNKREVTKNNLEVDFQKYLGSDAIISVNKSREASGSIKLQLVKNKDKQKRLELKAQYPDKDDSFIESLMWAYVTDSSIIGTAMGGNVAGAIIGDMLNDNTSETNKTDDLNNHSDDSIKFDTTDYSQSNNFS